MIRCIRLWTGPDLESYFEEGHLAFDAGPRGDAISTKLPTTSVSFQETASGGSFEWHTAPVRQLVVTLCGTLEFQVRSGARFILRPGDILLAEDTTGHGHMWKLIGPDPWRRMYAVLGKDVTVPFET